MKGRPVSGVQYRVVRGKRRVLHLLHSLNDKNRTPGGEDLHRVMETIRTVLRDCSSGAAVDLMPENKERLLVQASWPARHYSFVIA